MEPILIAYIPVLHKGYVELFKKYPGDWYILGPDIIADYTSLTRDVRAVDPDQIRSAIEALGLVRSVSVLTKSDLPTIAKHAPRIVMPDEEVSHTLRENHFPLSDVEFASIFLRWDKMPTLRENVVAPHRIISTNEFDQEMMKKVASEAEKSSDWWRQNGAIILRDGEIIGASHNSHLPTDFHMMADGDPRVNFDAGVRYDLSTAIHAEASAIAACAKKGVALKGAAMYASTFPCPTCARLIAASGIKKVYYEKGYSLLDAENIFSSFGVEIVLVQ